MTLNNYAIKYELSEDDVHSFVEDVGCDPNDATFEEVWYQLHHDWLKDKLFQGGDLCQQTTC